MMTAERVEVGSVRRVGHRVRIQKAAGVGTGPEGSATVRRWHRRTVDVHAGVLLFPLGSAVLKPDFYLRERRERNITI